MNTMVEKYELTQNGKKYILTTQAEGEFVKLRCYELDAVNPPTFFGDFTLAQLGQLCSKFNTFSSIYDALALVNQTIEREKVGVEQLGDFLNIILYFESGIPAEEYTMKIGLNHQTQIYQDSNINNNYVQEVVSSEPVLPATTYDINAYTQGVTYENTYTNTIPIQTTITDQNIYSTNDLLQTTAVGQNLFNGITDQNVYQTTYTTPTETIPTETYTNYANYNYGTYNTTTTEVKTDTYNTISTPKYEKLKLSLSPEREKIQMAMPGSTTTTQIKYSSAPSHKEPDQQITILKEETIRIKREYDLLKDESNKLNAEIAQLKAQIQILLEENKTLRENNGTRLNENQIHEINFLKEENEKLKKELEKYIALQSTFDEYKRLKEEEIKYLKLQIEELLRNSTKNRSDSLRAQTLTLQDSRLEIVKGDIIKSTEELELLTRKICKNHKKVTLDLLYKATIDSDKAAAFHNKCDWADKTLVLIRSGNGKRFGGYTSVNWKGNCLEKKDENAFVFSLDKLQIYDVNPGEDAIGCYPKYGPVFLGCQIRVYDQFFTKGGTTFERGLNYNTQEDYELTGGQKKFDVKELEVYSVQLE